MQFSQFNIEFQVLAFSIWWLLPGHSCVLQLSVIFEEPKHSCPPFSASIFGSRTFMRIPPPHSLEHSPIFHSFHSQSTVFQYANFILYHYRGMQSSKNDLKIKKQPEHSFVLQISVILFEPVHCFPPLVALIFGALTFVRVPEPHSLEQSPIFHISHSQST